MSKQKPTVGRIVHFRPELSQNKGQPYPAMITHVWSDTCVNLSVFNDGSYALPPEHLKPTSVTLGDGPRSWGWPPRS